MKKQYKSSVIKNHKITKKSFFDGVSLKGYISFLGMSSEYGLRICHPL